MVAVDRDPRVLGRGRAAEVKRLVAFAEDEELIESILQALGPEGSCSQCQQQERAEEAAHRHAPT